MGKIFRTREVGDHLFFSTALNSYLFSAKERAVYKVTQDLDMENLHKDAEELTFDIPTKEEVEDLLNRELSQVILNFTENCNLRCRYCLFGECYPEIRTYTPREMPVALALETVEFFIKRASKTKKPFVQFYGGEPMLRFGEILEVVDRSKNLALAHGIELNFIIVTNGTHLGKREVEEVVKRNICLQISLDGPRPVHDLNRVYPQGKGTFDTVFDNIKFIYKNYPEYYKRSVLYSATISHLSTLPEVMEFFSQPLFEENVLNLNFVNDYERNSYFSTYLDEEDKRKGKEILSSLRKQFVEEVTSTGKATPFLSELFGRKLMDIHFLLGSDPSSRLPLNGTCIPGVRRFYVSVDGDFYVCEKVSERYKIGSVKHGFDIERIITLMEDYAKLSEDCKNCFARDLCRICFAGVLDSSEELSEERKKRLCAMEKEGIKDAFVLYAEIMERNPRALDFLKETELY